jgi:putative FmdB family regulatory protein
LYAARATSQIKIKLLLELKESFLRSPEITMPTYEYECEKCEKTFELFQSMKDEPIKVCTPEVCRMEEWGKGSVRRLLGSGAGLIFKGSGFYITDYRSEGYKQAAKKESSHADSAGSGGAGGETASKSDATKSSSEAKTSAKQDQGNSKS